MSTRARARTRKRPIRFGNLIIAAALIGIVGGVVAAGYYYILEGLLHLIWDVGRPAVQSLPGAFGWAGQVWLITLGGGALVGAAIRWFGSPGEISAVVDNIHLRGGRIDGRQTPAMTLTSLLSISFGGSAGPEAPLVQIIGSLGSRVGDLLRLYPSFVRTLTFCGMAAALSAFFGAPLGGALFALEIPHRRGLEYYEALIPALVAAGLSFLVFRGLTGIEGVLYTFTELPALNLVTVGHGIAMGVLGAGIGAAFMFTFDRIGRAASRLGSRPILLGAIGGLCIGLLAQAMPDDIPIHILFWSEYQIQDLIGAEVALVTQYGIMGAVGLLAAAVVLKGLSIGATLHSGFRGGFIFPLFFMGAAAGLAVHIIVPSIAAATAILCGMAAVNVAVTKTPVSSTVILAAISGTGLIPIIGAASMASYLLTTRIALIRTQRSRPRYAAVRRGD